MHLNWSAMWSHSAKQEQPLIDSASPPWPTNDARPRGGDLPGRAARGSVALRKMACRLPRGISQLAVQGHRLALEGAAFSRCPFVDGSGLATLQKNEAPGNLMPRFRWRNGPRARRGLRNLPRWERRAARRRLCSQQWSFALRARRANR
jgi:hypothetical protein